MSGDLLTPAQAAARLGCCTRHLSKLVADRKIKYIRVGLGTARPRKRFDPADLDAYVDGARRVAAHLERTSCPSPDAPGRRTGTTDSSTNVVVISDLLARVTGRRPNR